LAAAMVVVAAVAGAWWWRDEVAVRFVPLDVLVWIRQIGESGDSRFGRDVEHWANAIMGERSCRLMASVRDELDAEFATARAQCDRARSTSLAGFYVQDYGPRLALTPDGRFACYQRGVLSCCGSPPGQEARNAGVFNADDYTVRLTPRFDARLPHFRCDTEYFVVPWRGCTLLIPPAQIPNFCESVNTGNVGAALGWALRRHGVRFAHDRTLPRVPAEFERLLLAQPIQLTLVELVHESQEPGGLCEIRARFDRGEDDGVIPETVLFSTESRFGSDDIKVTAFVVELTAHECIADFRIYWYDGQAFEPPRVGVIYSTRDPHFDDAMQDRLLDETVDADFRAPEAASSE